MRDSHGLFDYESRNINKKNIRTSDAGRIVRIDDEIEFLSHDSPSLAALTNGNSPDDGVTQVLQVVK